MRGGILVLGGCFFFFFLFLLVFYDLICWRVRNFVKTLKVKGCLLV